MRILDLGCGTGAVTLGFLEMFSHPPLNGIKIEIDAIDISSPSLNRLKQLVDTLNFSGFQINTIQMDLRDISTLEKYLSCNAPYDIVFAANVLNELEHVQSIELIKSISQHLTNMAFIVIASAAKDFIKKKLQQMLITDANNRGLFVYYPCPSYSSSNSSHKCWFWRAHEYKYKTLRKKDGRIIPPGRFREQLVATWLILSNQQLTIYDDFKSSYPELEWGVFGIRGSDSRIHRCEICTGKVEYFLAFKHVTIKEGWLRGFQVILPLYNNTTNYNYRMEFEHGLSQQVEERIFQRFIVNGS